MNENSMISGDNFIVLVDHFPLCVYRCSYLELIPLLSDKDEIYSANIPNHWMKAIFLAHAHVELLLSDKGIKLYNELQRCGFKNSTYMVAQIGKAFHNKRSKFFLPLI